MQIVSLVFRYGNTGRFLHWNFVTSLLNDLFGIQCRGGCACAGPYGMELLGLEESVEKIILASIEESELFKPGFVRVSLGYYWTHDTLQFVIDAVNFIANEGWRFLPEYEFNARTGMWNHKAFVAKQNAKAATKAASTAAAPTAAPAAPTTSSSTTNTNTAAAAAAASSSAAAATSAPPPATCATGGCASGTCGPTSPPPPLPASHHHTNVHDERISQLSHVDFGVGHAVYRKRVDMLAKVKGQTTYEGAMKEARKLAKKLAAKAAKDLKAARKEAEKKHKKMLKEQTKASKSAKSKNSAATTTTSSINNNNNNNNNTDNTVDKSAPDSNASSTTNSMAGRSSSTVKQISETAATYGLQWFVLPSEVARDIRTGKEPHPDELLAAAAAAAAATTAAAAAVAKSTHGRSKHKAVALVVEEEEEVVVKPAADSPSGVRKFSLIPDLKVEVAAGKRKDIPSAVSVLSALQNDPKQKSGSTAALVAAANLLGAVSIQEPL